MKYQSVNSSAVAPLRRDSIVYRHRGHREAGGASRYLPIVVAVMFGAALLFGFVL
jgi:hypothetical protein